MLAGSESLEQRVAIPSTELFCCRGDHDIWTIQQSDQQAAEAANSIATPTSEAMIVAIHLRTPEQLTHKQVVNLACLFIKNNPGMTVQLFEVYLQQMGATCLLRGKKRYRLFPNPRKRQYANIRYSLATS